MKEIYNSGTIGEYKGDYGGKSDTAIIDPRPVLIVAKLNPDDSISWEFGNFYEKFLEKTKNIEPQRKYYPLIKTMERAIEKLKEL